MTSEVSHVKITDSFGNRWPVNLDRCSVCGQPDNSGDCNHKLLTPEDVRALGGTPRTAIISVEYEILAGIKVDVETGEIVEVIAWTEGMNGTEPAQVYAGDHYGYETGDLDEYLAEDSEVREKAVAIASGVSVTGHTYPYYREGE